MYFTLKKKLALCMALVMLLTLLVGCTKEEQNPAGTISDFESQAHFQVSTPENTSTPEEGTMNEKTSQTPLTGEFVVSEKKYDYKNANLMLLYVENQTDRHYNVTIKGKYLDASGKVIKNESQIFKAFPAGWSNHFIFYPKVAFDSFTYELEMEEYVYDPLYSDSDENPLAPYFELTYEKKLDWQRSLIGDTNHPIEGRMMFFYAEMTNNHPTVTISPEFHVLVLDTNGNIYVTDYDTYYESISWTAVDPVGGTDNGRRRFQISLLEQPRGDDESIPDNVQGVFTAIFAVRDVVDYDELMEHW